MAAANYYLCDKCRSKTYYDSDVDYDDRVGAMAVLCIECAKTHAVIVTPIDQANEAAELRAAVKLYLARLDDYEADQYPRGSIARLKKNKALKALRAALAATEGQP